jgi:hypothetical protein
MIRQTSTDSSNTSKTNLLRVYNILEYHETLESVRQIKLRIEVLSILETLIRLHSTTRGNKSAKFFSETNRMITILIDNFIFTIPPSQQEQIDQTSEYAFGKNGVDEVSRDSTYADSRWFTSYNGVFAIMVIRKALKHDGLPIVQAKKWVDFARLYAGVVMGA